MESPAGASAERPKPTLTVSQADTKWLLAIKTHIGQLIRTAMRPDRKAFMRPVEMDHGELLLAAASLRALFFDNGARPLMTRLVEDAGLEIEVETVETNLGLVLLSQLLPEPGHVSDYIAGGFLDPQRHDRLPLDKPTSVLIFYDSPKGVEDLQRRPVVWVPSKERDAEIKSWLTHASNVGPSQMLTMTRRKVRLADWGSTRLGFLKELAITRRNIIEYVANRLGGVHYDSKRMPSDPSDVQQFRTLATAYDWKNQSLMHAGFVATGLACMEVLNAPGVVDVYHQCGRLLAERQRQLVAKARAEVDGKA